MPARRFEFISLWGIPVFFVYAVLNWFKAKGQMSAGAVEGFNGKAKMVTEELFGFRTPEAVKTALYHNLGALPVRTLPQKKSRPR